MEDAKLEALLKPILELYSQIELELLCNIAEQFDTYDTVGGTLEWYLTKLQEMGVFKNDNLRVIRDYAGLTAKEMKHLLQEVALATSLQEVGADLSELMNSAANRHILESIEQSLMDDIDVINTKALESANKAYMDTLTKSYIETSSGAYSYQESIRKALVEMADNGISGATYQRESGKVVRYSLEAAVRRDTLTRAHQTAVEVQMNNMRELGHNLVYVSQHMGARVHPTNKIANHAGWQGKVYMLDGSSEKYPNFIEATGYGDIQGFAGVNCRHHLSSYIEGVTKLPTRIDEAENERVYQLSQEQRKLERDVRKSKKQLAVASQMGDKNLAKRYRDQLNAKTEKLDEFVKDHPELKRDYLRTQIVRNTHQTNDKKPSEEIVIEDITEQILKEAKPHQGSIRYADNWPEGQKAGREEKAYADWSIEKLGGDITHIPKSREPGVETPDYRWKFGDEQNLELKTFTSKSLDRVSKQMKKASSQIGGSGWVALDFTSSSLWNNQPALFTRIEQDLRRFNIDFVLIKHGVDLVRVYHKKR